VLDEDWMRVVEDSQGPYFIVAEGVFAYLERAPQVLTRIAARFPGALMAFDTESHRLMEMQHKLAAKKNMEARWAWACDDPRSLEPLGLEVLQTTAVTRPPRGMRTRLPGLYRYLLPIAGRIMGGPYSVTLFRTRPQPSA
jgi:O-methyltransferase involved in polyketide biosynthesis